MTTTTSGIQSGIQKEYFDTDPITKNPIFDFNTPREIRLLSVRNSDTVPIYSNTTGLALNQYDCWSWDGETHYIYEYKKDKRGQVLLDDNNNPIHVMVKEMVDNGAGSTTVHEFPKTKSISIPDNSYLPLKVPEDNGLIMQLLRCPAVANVEFIDGKSTRDWNKKIIIFDVGEQEKIAHAYMNNVEVAMTHALGLPEKELNPVYAVLQLGNPYYKKLSIPHKKRAIIDFSEENPHDYIERIIEKFDPEFALFRLSECMRLIRLNNGVYTIAFSDGRTVVLGNKEMNARQFILNDASLRNELINETGFDPTSYNSDELVAHKRATNSKNK